MRIENVLAACGSNQRPDINLLYKLGRAFQKDMCCGVGPDPNLWDYFGSEIRNRAKMVWQVLCDFRPAWSTEPKGQTETASFVRKCRELIPKGDYLDVQLGHMRELAGQVNQALDDCRQGNDAGQPGATGSTGWGSPPVADDPVRFATWGIGLTEKGLWWLFEERGTRWEDRGQLDVSKGFLQQLLKKFLDNKDHVVTRRELARMIAEKEVSRDEVQRLYIKSGKYYLHQLRKLIRDAIAGKRTRKSIPKTQNPIPADKNSQSHKLMLQLGHVLTDAQYRKRFRPKSR